MTHTPTLETQKQLRAGRIRLTVGSIVRHLVLLILAVVWLVPILWLLVTSLSSYPGINFRSFFPDEYTLQNYVNILFHSDSVAQFPQWFMNTLIVACFNCVISTAFVVMVAYAMSCCRFKSRRLLQNLSVTVNLFPGVLAMIAVYFVLRYLNLTNSYAGLIMVYAGSSGLGYLICKGFFDTVPVSLREAAKLDGASEAQTFFHVILPMSKPILVYTVISSFMVPWTDFVMAKMILNSGISTDWTVAIGLYNMLSRTLINNYFALFCAGSVLVSIPISVLFIIMQRFYVSGITSGADKG
ncbi:MAG: ABC transporter permease subunit [Candidatus Fournierella pullistercoris]|uniref:ABC transporter permease subunit n=1 Tax=Candidatus Allofournierella pullistercoris TaxID=2838597 RepID=A0A948T2M0_9FIRM|nr:ABC transporter permease subunit [Candidatus Fournierella pullistercoris]